MNSLKIKQLKLQQYGCFNNSTISFVDKEDKIQQWTVLLGNNNTGKTSILKALAELLPQKLITPTTTETEDNSKYVPTIFYDRYILDYFQENGEVTAQLSEAIGTKPKQWGYSKTSVKVLKDSTITNLNIFGYGVSRYPSSTSLAENKTKQCETLFSADARLINIEEWLMQLDYAAKNDKTVANNRLYRIKELICGNLFPEITDFKFESSDTLHNYVLFQTNDGWFRYTQLGYGYQSMLSWVIDLCKRMFDIHSDLENPLHGDAVVLVDEIDLHLHPQWQRSIISYLSSSFPNVQFIVTTHSPLVIQSMENINLYVLFRDEKDKICIERSNQTNYNGWTVDEILRDTMKLDSNIFSDKYNLLLEMFQTGLDQNDKEKVEKAYSELKKILHATNPLTRLLELQKNSME